MKHIIILIGLLLVVRTLGQAQDPRLAEQYYNNGEYEKAAVIFEQLYKKNPFSFFLYKLLVTSTATVTATIIDNAFSSSHQTISVRYKYYSG